MTVFGLSSPSTFRSSRQSPRGQPCSGDNRDTVTFRAGRAGTVLLLTAAKTSPQCPGSAAVLLQVGLVQGWGAHTSFAGAAEHDSELTGFPWHHRSISGVLVRCLGAFKLEFAG